MHDRTRTRAHTGTRGQRHRQAGTHAHITPHHTTTPPPLLPLPPPPTSPPPLPAPSYGGRGLVRRWRAWEGSDLIRTPVRVCVCVCVRERERERENVHACVRACVRVVGGGRMCLARKLASQPAVWNPLVVTPRGKSSLLQSLQPPLPPPPPTTTHTLSVARSHARMHARSLDPSLSSSLSSCLPRSLALLLPPLLTS